MAAPALCTVSGKAYLGGTGQGGVLVRWRVVSSTPPVAAGDGHASGDPKVTYTDSSGAWSISVPQGLSIWLEIPALGVDHTFTAPAASTAAFGDLSLTEKA